MKLFLYKEEINIKLKRLFSIICLVVIVCVFVKNINSNKNDTTTLSQQSEIENNTAQTSNIPEKEEIKPVFSSSSIPNDIKEKMLGSSMPSSEPVSFDELSYIELSYYDFNGNVNTGEMVVNKAISDEVVDIFKELYDKKYPIEKIRLIDEYNAIDAESMADNNSSSFCYRTIANTNKISNHGLGIAIDINPLQNPHVVNGVANPIEGQEYANRSNYKPGMIVEGDDLYNAFVSRGWTWGGHWKNPDYQHFEKSL